MQPTSPKNKTITTRVTTQFEHAVLDLAFASSSPTEHISKAEAAAGLMELGFGTLLEGRLDPAQLTTPLHGRLLRAANKLYGKTRAHPGSPSAAAPPPPEASAGAPVEDAAPPVERVVEYEQVPGAPAGEDPAEGPGPLGNPARKGGPGPVGERPRKRAR